MLRFSLRLSRPPAPGDGWSWRCHPGGGHQFLLGRGPRPPPPSEVLWAPRGAGGTAGLRPQRCQPGGTRAVPSTTAPIAGSEVPFSPAADDSPRRALTKDSGISQRRGLSGSPSPPCSASQTVSSPSCAFLSGVAPGRPPTPPSPPVPQMGHTLPPRDASSRCPAPVRCPGRGSHSQGWGLKGKGGSHLAAGREGG